MQMRSTRAEPAEGELAGILGYEDRPLVSADFVNDSRSGMSMVDDGGRQPIEDPRLYDNEYGYAFGWLICCSRAASLCCRQVGRSRAGPELCPGDGGVLGVHPHRRRASGCWCPALPRSRLFARVAAFFLLYEFMDVTNLLGGCRGSASLNQTLLAGWAQIVTLAILPCLSSWSSGVGGLRDGRRRSGWRDPKRSKSAVKYVAGEGENALFVWRC